MTSETPIEKINSTTTIKEIEDLLGDTDLKSMSVTDSRRFMRNLSFKIDKLILGDKKVKRVSR